MSQGHDILHSHHSPEIKTEQFSFGGKAKTFCFVLMVVGVLLTAIGIATIPKDAAHNENGAAKHTDHTTAVPTMKDDAAGGDHHGSEIAPGAATANTHDAMDAHSNGNSTVNHQHTATSATHDHEKDSDTFTHNGAVASHSHEGNTTMAHHEGEVNELGNHSSAIEDGSAVTHEAHHEGDRGHEYGQNIKGVDTLHSNEQTHPVIEEHAKPWTTRIWTNVLLNGYFLLLISICALFFCALQYLANAGWSAAIIRVPQAMSTFIPVAATVVLIAFLAGKNDIYHWVHYENEHVPKGAENYDKILDGKKWFLNTPFVLGCIIIIPIIWHLFGMKLRGLSHREDSEGAEYKNKKSPFFLKSVRWSAAFTIFFGFTLSMLSWILIMSIDAHWFSTMFSIYNFATGWVSCLTIICFFVLFLRSAGYLKLVTDEHIHDLGKFMFAFTIFWTYLWLAQFLLIWYANIPEESVHFYQRWQPEWKLTWFANLLFGFLIPFLLLMTRNNKRNPINLVGVGLIILIGHWTDLYLMIMPGSIGKSAHIGMLEIGMTLMFAGVFMFWVFTALTKKSLIPINHPYIEESANHDVGV